jgi:hypothetical protein
MRMFALIAVAALAALAVLGGTPSHAQAGACPTGYALIANEDLPVPAPPYGADLNRNGYQCAATSGNILFLTDDVPEDSDVNQCGNAFSPVQVDPLDESLTAKDRNQDGIVYIRVLEIQQANGLEVFHIRDN